MNDIYPVPGYAGYFVSRDSQLFSQRRGDPHKLMPYCASGRRSYCTVHGNITIQAAMLLTFVGPRPAGHEATILDGDKTNLAISNFGWRTRKEIIRSEIDRGVNYSTAPGTPSSYRRLTDQQAQEIRSRIASGEKQSALAREYGVSAPVITWIKTGHHYKNPRTPRLAESQLLSATTEHQDLKGTPHGGRGCVDSQQPPTDDRPAPRVFCRQVSGGGGIGSSEHLNTAETRQRTAGLPA